MVVDDLHRNHERNEPAGTGDLRFGRASFASSPALFCFLFRIPLSKLFVSDGMRRMLGSSGGTASTFHPPPDADAFKGVNRAKVLEILGDVNEKELAEIDELLLRQQHPQQIIETEAKAPAAVACSDRASDGIVARIIKPNFRKHGLKHPPRSDAESRCGAGDQIALPDTFPPRCRSSKSEHSSLEILKLCRWSSVGISDSLEVVVRHPKVGNLGMAVVKSKRVSSRVTPSSRSWSLSEWKHGKNHAAAADETFPLPPPSPPPPPPVTASDKFHPYPISPINPNSEDQRIRRGHPLPLPTTNSKSPSPQREQRIGSVIKEMNIHRLPPTGRSRFSTDPRHQHESCFCTNHHLLIEKSSHNSPQAVVHSPISAPSTSQPERPSRKPNYLLPDRPFLPRQLPTPPQSPSSKGFCPGNWRKGNLLGRGTFGNVYEGWNVEDGSFFAVKVSINEGASPEIQQEVNLLSKLNHPNIVRYYGSSIKDGRLCIFLELVRMGSLASILKKYKRFEDHTIRSYTRQILLGLQYLHAKKTLHRDIKCANILVDVDGQVKLSDFGMAKQIGEVLASSVKGTLLYMAPEVLTAHGNHYSFSADIWSLGCTVQEMADGKPPWSDLKGFGFIFKLKNAELPPLPEHLSPEGKDFIRSCLRFNPEDRPTAQELLQHPFVA